MAEKLRTDLTTSTDRGLHPAQHNEVNARFLALEAAVEAGTATGPANDLPAQDGDYNAHGYRIRNLGAPVTGGDAATKGYTDSAVQALLPKPLNALPAQTGTYSAQGFRITSLSAPVAGTDAATKQYADTAAAQPINGLPAQTGDYDTNGYRIIGLPPPTDNTAPATKRYTDEAIAAAITEPVTLPLNQLPAQTGDYDAHGYRITGLAGPVGNADAATKKYADDAAASAASGVSVPAPQPVNLLPAQTGDYNARGFKLTGLPAPSADTDAATKKYTDTAVAGVAVPVIPPANALPPQTADYNARGFKLANLAPPVVGSDAATKQYTDDKLALYSGGTATPANKLPAQTGDYDAQGYGITNLRPPVSNTDAATKKFVADTIAAIPAGNAPQPINALPPQAAHYDARGFKLTNLGAPAAATDAATKKYTDDAIAAIPPQPVNLLPAQTADYNARGFKLGNLGAPSAVADAATKKYTDDTVGAATAGVPQIRTDMNAIQATLAVTNLPDLRSDVNGLQDQLATADLPGMRTDIDDLDAAVDALVSAPAGGLTRQTSSFPLGTVAAGATVNTTITLSPSFTVLAVTVSAASVRFRAYISPAHRTGDAARPVTTAATADAGLILEYVSTDNARHYLSPVATGYGTDPGSNDVAVAVTNTGASGPVTVELVWMALEKAAA